MAPRTSTLQHCLHQKTRPNETSALAPAPTCHDSTTFANTASSNKELGYTQHFGKKLEKLRDEWGATSARQTTELSLSHSLTHSLSLSLTLSLTLSLSLTLILSLFLSFSLSLSFFLSLSLSLSLSLTHSDVDVRSPVAGRVRSAWPDNRRCPSSPTQNAETATAVQLKNRKSQTSRWNPVTLTREFTQNQRHEARNAPSPAFHWHLFCATAIQPTARGSPPRSSRVHPYARSRHDSQRHALNLCG